MNRWQSEDPDGRSREEPGGIGRYLRTSHSIIVLCCVAVFLIQDLFLSQEQNYQLINEFGLYWPAVFEEGEWYRLITYMFLHSGFEHLINNMIILMFIGDHVERAFGKFIYTLIYFSSGIIAGIVSIVYNMEKGQAVLSIGASGAGFGIIGAFAGLLALNRGHLHNMPLSRVFLFVALSLYGGFTAQGIDNAAHIGGLLAGSLFAAVLWMRKRRRGYED